MNRPHIALGYAGTIVAFLIIAMIVVIFLHKRNRFSDGWLLFLECVVVALMIVGEFLIVVPNFGW